jgi:hypothetical protein
MADTVIDPRGAVHDNEVEVRGDNDVLAAIPAGIENGEVDR